jgi:hypothetical protein
MAFIFKQKREWLICVAYSSKQAGINGSTDVISTGYDDYSPDMEKIREESKQKINEYIGATDTQCTFTGVYRII